jgi:hypothetical protein
VQYPCSFQFLDGERIHAAFAQERERYADKGLVASLVFRLGQDNATERPADIRDGCSVIGGVRASLIAKDGIVFCHAVFDHAFLVGLPTRRTCLFPRQQFH